MTSSNDVGPSAAVYCSAILQLSAIYCPSRTIQYVSTSTLFIFAVLTRFVTSKVLSAAVDGHCGAEENGRKRRRDETDGNSDNDDGNASWKPPSKKRRINPSDIARALQTDPLLKEWSSMMGTFGMSRSQNLDDAAIGPESLLESEIDAKSSPNPLDGVIIALESNLDISNTQIPCKLVESLQSLCDEAQMSIDDGLLKGHVVEHQISSLLQYQFTENRTEYAFPFLIHISSLLSQQLRCAASMLDHRFVVMPQSPMWCSAMAMLLAKRQWLKHNDFRLYVNCHRNELFPPHSGPDIIVFLCGTNLENNQNIPTSNMSLLDYRDRQLMDDFYFELVIKQIVSRKHGKILFLNASALKQDMCFVGQMIVDVLTNKKAVPKVHWESDLKAFNNVQNPDIVKSRIIYEDEQQIVDGLEMMERGQVQHCDTVYVHISVYSYADTLSLSLHVGCHWTIYSF